MLIDIKRDINHQNTVNSSQAKSVDDDKNIHDFGVDHNVNVKRNSPSLEPIIAVVVIACNRPDYIRQTLDNLLK